MNLPLKVHRLLGGGTYGSVYEVETVDKLRFAAKVLKQLDQAYTHPENELHDLPGLGKGRGFANSLQFIPIHCSGSWNGPCGRCFNFQWCVPAHGLV